MAQPINEEEMKRLEDAFRQIVEKNLGAKKSGRWSTVMILSLLVILITVGAGYYLYKKKYKKSKNHSSTKKEVVKAEAPAKEAVKSESKKITISEQ